MRGGRVGSLAASPTLVGAVTVLVVVVAVFLAYQANKGLPFVPTYKLSAELPDAPASSRATRCGSAASESARSSRSSPRPSTNAPCPNDPTGQCTTQVAKVDMDLNQDLKPLPENSTIVVRAKSALGLKYLEINRGNSSQGFKPGSTVAAHRGTARARRDRQVFNMFDAPRGPPSSRTSRVRNALAGRGVDLNKAIGQLEPLVQVLTR